jgi:hypothetical protein
MNHEEKQAAYADKRQAHTRAARYATKRIRIYTADGHVLIRPYIGLSAAVAEWPDAWRVEDADAADARA